jgi:hypothetical protein
MTLIYSYSHLIDYSPCGAEISWVKSCPVYTYTSHWTNTLGSLFNYLPWRDCSARWIGRRPVGSRWRLSPGWGWWCALPSWGWRYTGCHPRRRHILPDKVGIRICLLDRRHCPIPEYLFFVLFFNGNALNLINKIFIKIFIRGGGVIEEIETTELYLWGTLSFRPNRVNTAH